MRDKLNCQQFKSQPHTYCRTDATLSRISQCSQGERASDAHLAFIEPCESRGAIVQSTPYAILNLLLNELSDDEGIDKRKQRS